KQGAMECPLTQGDLEKRRPFCGERQARHTTQNGASGEGGRCGRQKFSAIGRKSHHASPKSSNEVNGLSEYKPQTFPSTLNPEKNPVSIEHEQHEPLDDHNRYCKEQRLVRSSVPNQSTEKETRGKVEIHKTASHVNQNRVGADHNKNHCPSTEFPDIDDEVKQ